MNTKLYLSALLLAIGFASCSDQEPPFYNPEGDGIYFDYDEEKDFETTVNFSKYVLESDKEYEDVPVQLNILGYPAKTDRVIKLKTEAVEEYAQADVMFPENCVVPADSLGTTIMVKVKRPEVLGETYAVKLLFDVENPEHQFSAGVNGKLEFKIFVKETYAMPDSWKYYGGNYYLGEWSVDKHVFVARVVKNADLNKYFDWGDTFPEASVQVVDSIRAHEKATGEKLPFAVPFYLPYAYMDTYIVKYNKPDYWKGTLEEYLGKYDPYMFAAIAQKEGINTSNENEVFGEMTADYCRNSLNKFMVEKMFETYSAINQNMYSEPVTKQFGIPVFDDIDYSVSQPFGWKQGSSLLRPYIGAYSAAKLQFMIKTLYAAKVAEGDKDFCLYLMFPIIMQYNKDDKSAKPTPAISDAAFEGTKYASADEALRDFNRIFRAADPDNKYKFPAL